ncbi:MAG: hypothetical protein WAN36_04610 [Calditrichia bacterium]
MTHLEKHLYLILYPNEALVASQLSPSEFGRHYAVGSPKHFSGKVIFAEVDINFRNDHFMIEEYLERTDSGVAGVPKKTKFIKSYRVLEHIGLNSLMNLYLVTVDGHVLGLKKDTDFAHFHQAKRIRIYQEISPLQLLVASNLDPIHFGKYITRETESKGAPKIFFTQYDVNIEDVMKHQEARPLPTSPLPNVNPRNLNVALMELAGDSTKRTKTISLNEVLDYISYSKIKHGFWMSDGDDLIFYALPSANELEEKHYLWWRSVYK